MIKIDRLSKVYPNGVVANKDISFEVHKGEIVSLVGPNGSGKTTLIRQILGILSIDHGSIDIGGRGHTIASLSYCPQLSSIYPGLTVHETLLAVLKFLGRPKHTRSDIINRTLESLNLAKQKNQLTFSLSGGQLKALSLACVLVQEKEYLILDEVTSMIDIHSKERIWGVLEEEKAKGKAILLSSHDITEIKRITDRMIVLQQGQVLFEGNPNQITSEFCQARVRLSPENPIFKQNFPELLALTKVSDQYTLVAPSIEVMFNVLNQLTQEGRILSLEIEHPAIYQGLLAMFSKQG